MKFVKDQVVFSTGKTRYTCSEVLGLTEDGTIYYGSDGCFYDPDDGAGDNPADAPLTHAELVELADHMIDRWQKFRQQISGSERTSLDAIGVFRTT